MQFQTNRLSTLQRSIHCVASACHLSRSHASGHPWTFVRHGRVVALRSGLQHQLLQPCGPRSQPLLRRQSVVLAATVAADYSDPDEYDWQEDPDDYFHDTAERPTLSNSLSCQAASAPQAKGATVAAAQLSSSRARSRSPPRWRVAGGIRPKQSAQQHSSSLPRAFAGDAELYHGDDAFAAHGAAFQDDDDYFLRGSTKSALSDGDYAEDWEQLADGRREETALDRVRLAALVAAHFLASVPGRTLVAVRMTAAGLGGMLRDARHRAGSSAGRTPVGRAVARAHYNWEEAAAGLPKDLWGRVLWIWERPSFKRLRFTISMANLSVRLPAIMAIIGTQIGLLATQVSLPMLAPLLLGTGMMFRSIKANASIIFPRIGLLVVLLWILWFANSVVQNSTEMLRRQGAIDNRVAGAIINGSEICVLVAAVVIMLSMLGINLSGLLLPAGVAFALASKDLTTSFLAGFFLFAVQPFKLGDRIGVSYSSSAPSMAGGPQGAWFEGVCEKVDLRYTTIKSGRRRLLVPNSAFLTREFIVLDDSSDANSGPMGPRQQQQGWRAREADQWRQQEAEEEDDRYEWVRRTVLSQQPFHAEHSVQSPEPLSVRDAPQHMQPLRSDGSPANGSGRPHDSWSGQRPPPQPRRVRRQQNDRRRSGSQPPRFQSDEQHMWERQQHPLGPHEAARVDGTNSGSF